MELWTIQGSKQGSGTKVVVTIEAATEENARQQAAELGIVVSAVHRSVVDRSFEAPPFKDMNDPSR